MWGQIIERECINQFFLAMNNDTLSVSDSNPASYE